MQAYLVLFCSALLHLAGFMFFTNWKFVATCVKQECLYHFPNNIIFN